MKLGFTLIEVLLATVVASIAALLLTNAVFQIQRTRARVDNYADMYARAALAQHQLAQDISGAFIPVQAELKQTGTGEQQKVKSIDKVFYSINEGGNLKTLTCITNNPMQVYWGDQIGGPQPKVARVVYTLEQDKTKKDSYKLLRQQGDELDFAPYKDKKIRSYELVDGIKECTVEYIAMLEKQTQTEQTTMQTTAQVQVTKTTTKQQIERQKKTFKDWQIDRKKQEEQKKQNQQVMPLIPHTVIIRLVLWDIDYKQSTPFEFVIPIVTSLDRSLYPPQNNKPQQNDPKRRIIGRQQAHRVRRRPMLQARRPMHRHSGQHMRRFEITQGKTRPQLRVTQ